MVTVRPSIACLAIAALSACGGGGAPSAGAPSAGAPAAAPAAGELAPAPLRPEPQGDAAIAAAVYADVRVPPGFHVEPPRYDAAYATLVHLRNTDLDATASPPRELCAADFAAAFALDETVARSQPVYADLVENNTSPRYHEFVRRLRTALPRHAITRIYRCDYLDRADADLRVASGSAGRFTLPGFGADDLRLLGEYLWTFSPDNNAGRAVLASETTASAATAVHRLHVARLVRATPPATCDRIEVWRIELTARRADGALLRTESPAFAFGAHRADGVTSLCR